MGRSSTNFPEFNQIRVRKNYDNLSQVEYNPQVFIDAYNESAQESIHSIREERQQDQDGYCSDEEDYIKHPDPRKRSVFQKIKKNCEVSTVHQYHKCAKFGQHRLGVIKMSLNKIRTLLMVPALAVLGMSFVTTELMWFLYYFTYWGLIASIVSLATSIKAVSAPERYQQAAVVSSEISLSLNFVITILFWTYMAPMVFRDLEWQGIDLFLRIQLSALHVIPLLSTLANVVLTDITFFKRDWKLVMMTGCSYTLANCLGSLALGHALYPVVDWQVPTETVMFFVIIAGWMSCVHVMASHLTQRHKAFRRKQKELPSKQNRNTCIQ